MTAPHTHTRTVTAAGPDQRREPAGCELGQVVRHLLEPRGGGALLERLHRVEAELRLAVLGGLAAVEVGVELGEVGAGEADLAGVGDHQRQVHLVVVLLELVVRVTLRVLVDHRHQRRARRRALLPGLGGDHHERAAAREVGDVVAGLLERRGRDPLLQCIHRVEVELGLAVEGRLLAVERGLELRQLRLGEADLRLAFADDGQVLRVVRLERLRVLGRVVDDREDRLRSGGRGCRGRARQGCCRRTRRACRPGTCRRRAAGRRPGGGAWTVSGFGSGVAGCLQHIGVEPAGVKCLPAQRCWSARPPRD